MLVRESYRVHCLSINWNALIKKKATDRTKQKGNEREIEKGTDR
jgi:hypothetical protein